MMIQCIFMMVQFFFLVHKLFDISLEEFRKYLKNYVEDRFNIKINDLT